MRSVQTILMVAVLSAGATFTTAADEIEMNRIAVLPVPARSILATAGGFDFDHDGKREFVLYPFSFDPVPVPLHFYELSSINGFVLAHVLDAEEHKNDAFYPSDAGDIDGDGLADLVLRVKDYVVGSGGYSDFGLRVYESISPDAYPTEFVWEDHIFQWGWWHGGRIVDADADGKLEIAIVQRGVDGTFAVYENDDDDSYTQVYSETVFDLGYTGQSFSVLNDIDEDGRTELLYGEVNQITAVENVGDDAYEVIWILNFSPVINISVIIDGGDLDGDGKREFLAGGLVTNIWDRHLHIFEAVADNEVEIVATLVIPSGGTEGNTVATLADVDGDGRREIVFGNPSNVTIFENVGNDTWESIWVGSGQYIWTLAAGDHDGDGKDEIVFNDGLPPLGETGVWEIDPRYQSDPDGDGTVTAIDNCPHHVNPGQEDADSDAVGDLCDNCVFGANPEQGEAPLGQTILASDRETFSWLVPADVIYVRGDLADIDQYAVDTIEPLVLATSLMDASIPDEGAGLYYLVRPDCLVGSWQTTVGSEPGRDVALP